MRDIVNGTIWALYRNLLPWKQTRSFTRFIKKNNHKEELIGCEVGVDLGINAKNMLMNLPIKELYLIDPYTTYYEYGYGKILTKSMDKHKEYAYNLLKRYKQVVWIDKFSKYGLKEIPGCDFIYIDGNHKEEYVYEDCQLALKKLNEDGVLGGHDYHLRSVGNAVDRFIKEHDFKLFTEYLSWWIIKK